MNLRDLATGSLMIGAGGGFVFAGIGYGVGSFSQMGAGFFPVSLGAVAILIGVGIGVSGAARSGGSAPEFPHWRALLGVAAAIAIFAGTVTRFGLVPATALTAAVLCVAEPGARARDVLLLGAGLSLACWLIFIRLLSLPLPAIRLP